MPPSPLSTGPRSCWSSCEGTAFRGISDDRAPGRAGESKIFVKSGKSFSRLLTEAKNATNIETYGIHGQMDPKNLREKRWRFMDGDSCIPREISTKSNGAHLFYRRKTV